MSPQIRDPQSAIRNGPWRLVVLTVAPGDAEHASVLLFDLGSTGIVTLEESSEHVKLGSYFARRKSDEDFRRDIVAALTRAGLAGACDGLSVETVADQDWLQKWKEGFAPTVVGRRLVVAPSWRLPDCAEGRHLIQIDPGMAFGTGTHETTRLCLEAIERYWRGASLLDVGTGTGILAIAAALLVPRSRVVAIDVDPQAVHVARENISLNKVSVELVEGQARDLSNSRFDVVVANLTAEVIIDTMDDLSSCAAPEGLMILSGILSEFAADVERSVENRGFTVVDRRDDGEWCALVAKRM